MSDNLAPLHKLNLFREEIGLNNEDMRALDPFRLAFFNRKEEFAEYFYELFWGIPATLAILEGEKVPGTLKQMWAFWFGELFSRDLDDGFLSWLWRIGVRHVAVSLDQRFSNLGFALIRQFCHRIIMEEIPLAARDRVFVVVDKLIDLCLLVETTAYIENTTNCDIEVMREMADRVRNPAMIIGWNVRKLQRKVDAGSKDYKVYEMLISENQRIEAMVKDIKVYMDLFQAEPHLETVHLRLLIDEVLETLRKETGNDGVKITVSIHGAASSLKGDMEELRYLFYHLLQNSFEAVPTENGVITVTSVPDPENLHYARISVFNTGETPSEDADKLFSPFFSTKLTGTGFGLPIAKVVARKHLGRLEVVPESGKGTTVVITLPKAEIMDDERSSIR
jgi:signal transduction histidine kinase